MPGPRPSNRQGVAMFMREVERLPAADRLQVKAQVLAMAADDDKPWVEHLFQHLPPPSNVIPFKPRSRTRRRRARVAEYLK